MQRAAFGCERLGYGPRSLTGTLCLEETKTQQGHLDLAPFPLSFSCSVLLVLGLLFQVAEII